MSDDADGESFANHPVTLGEARAERSHDAKDWRPRDALLNVLRGIDSGDIEVEELVIAYRSPDNAVSVVNATKSMVSRIGLLETGKLISATKWIMAE